MALSILQVGLTYTEIPHKKMNFEIMSPDPDREAVLPSWRDLASTQDGRPACYLDM